MRRISLAGLVLLTAMSAGCNLFGRGRMAAMLPLAGENADETVETSDPWIAAAAQEARPNLHREKEPDPLGVRKWFVSEETRDIERNLGIE